MLFECQYLQHNDTYANRGSYIKIFPKEYIHLGCIRLTLFRLFRNKNKISRISPDSQNSHYK